MRNIWRFYGGWYDGDPSHLKPAPAAALAAELAALAGGAHRLADRARELAAAGDLRLAGHLAELAAQAAPDDKGVHAVRAEVFGARAARGGVDDVEGHLLVGRARVAAERAATMKIEGAKHPRHRRVVGHRRRARADARRAGRDRRHRRPARRPARSECSTRAARTRPTRRCGRPTSATSTAPSRSRLEAWDAFGGLDALVNNAAIPKRTRVTDLTPADVAHLMDVDFHSPVRMSLAVLPRMLERGAGTIVFVSSMGGRIPIAERGRVQRGRSSRCADARKRCTSTSAAPAST